MVWIALGQPYQTAENKSGLPNASNVNGVQMEVCSNIPPKHPNKIQRLVLELVHMKFPTKKVCSKND